MELGETESLGVRLPGRGEDARPWCTLRPANGSRTVLSGPLSGLSLRIPFAGTPDAYLPGLGSLFFLDAAGRTWARCVAAEGEPCPRL